MANNLNQSFTADNFRRIFDYENRKGTYLENRFFPEIEKLAIKLKENKQEFRKLKKDKKNLDAEIYEKKRDLLNHQKKELKEEKETLLMSELETISRRVTKQGFKIPLNEIQLPFSDKRVYVADKSPSSYFALKQTQHNIRRIYKVKQSNRYNIVCQLRELLRDAFPKYIVRTDIESFYESIPRKRLSEKISKDLLLTKVSKKIITQILREYGEKSGSDKGIPRGVGISAYLAELYLRDLDEAIKSQNGLIYYARYVDDIIAIYSPEPNSDIQEIEKNIKDAIAKKGLKPSSAKTKLINLMQGNDAEFEYLGYKFSIQKNNIELQPSEKKINKYIDRLNISFDSYFKQAKSNEKKARKLLVKRLRFLTSNIRLANNKKRAVIGIYFSNSVVTSSVFVDELEANLKQHISTINSPRLKSRLERLSFKVGFEEKLMSKFSTKELAEIVRAWKYAE